MNYWETLLKFIKENEIIIDRPIGSRHPNFKDIVYPLNYGYLLNTTAIDGSGIDIFIGSQKDNLIQGIICTVDDKKKDAEIKIMYNCSEEEIITALDFLNKGWMRSIFIKNPMCFY
jgi:inorganic pyrophosphatase